MTKLELQIVLDGKGAVQGVKSLDGGMKGLTSSTQKADVASKGLWKQIALGTFAYQAATRAARELVEVGKQSVREFLNQEKADKALAASLEITSRPVAALVDHFKDFASQMQASTIYADDAVEGVQALLIQLTNLDKDGLDRATKGTIGLASVMGMDLQSAANLVAKAMAGNIGALSRYGIQVDQTKDKEGQRAEVMEKLEKFYGRAVADTETYAGKLTQLKNKYGDLQEGIGEFLLSNNLLIDSLNGIVDAIDGILHGHDRMMASMERENEGTMNSITRFREMAKAVGATGEEIRALSAKYKDVDDAGIKHEKMLRDLAKQYPEINKLLHEKKAAHDEEQKKMREVERGTNVLIETEKKHKEETEKHVETLEERWKAVQANIEKDREWQAYLNGMFPAVESYSDAWAENVDITNMAQEAMDGLQPTMDGLAKTTLKESEQTKKWSIDWQDANSVLEASAQLLSVVKQGLAALGIELGPQAEAFMGAAEGAQVFVDGLTKGNPLTMIAGGIKFLTGVVKAFAGDGIGEAIDRENEWMGLNKQLEEQLRDLAKETGSVHEATSIMLDEIIAGAAIGIDNFEQYADRIRGILSELDRGELTLAETQAEIGDSFSALIAKAEELGTSGSSSLLTLFDDLKGRGIEVAEITEYINAQMTSGLEGYKKYLEGDFSDATIGVFEGMLAYEKKVGENRGLIDGVQGITDALVGMSNATRLTEEEFDNFEMAARDAFDALRKKGFTEKESLTEMAPMLSRMIFLHNEYGLAIDAETQALIDKAKAEGVNLDKYKSQEEIFSDMDSSLRELVDIFKNAFPNAINATTNAFRGLNKEASNFNPDTEYTKPIPGKPDIIAAEGFYSPRLSRDTVIQAHRGEEVIITPQRETISGGGQRVTNINMALSGSITPESVAEAFMRAWRNNTRGMRSLMES